MPQPHEWWPLSHPDEKVKKDGSDQLNISKLLSQKRHPGGGKDGTLWVPPPTMPILDLFYSVALNQCVIISMAPSIPVNFLDLITINYVYARENTYKIQYILNSVIKVFHDPPKCIPWPPVENHWPNGKPQCWITKRDLTAYKFSQGLVFCNRLGISWQLALRNVHSLWNWRTKRRSGDFSRNQRQAHPETCQLDTVTANWVWVCQEKYIYLALKTKTNLLR